jgi:hypothetical protein
METQEKLICEHISVSRKQLWQSCQQAYKFRYHLKIIPDGPVQPYFTYGKLVHKIAEIYVQEQGKRKIEDITSDCLSGRIEIEKGEPPPNLDKEYMKKLPKHVTNIKELTDRIGFDGHLEYPFRLELNPPSEFCMVGFIDRLIIRGDKYFILDYKTTKKGMWRKTPTTIRKDLQLRAYGRVVQRVFNAKAENIKAALFYLDGANLVATNFTQEALDSAEKELFDAYQHIVNTNVNDVYGIVGDQCRRCDYRKICPSYSLL